MITTKLTAGSTIINEEDDSNNNVQDIGPDGGDDEKSPMLHMVRQCVYDFVGVPVTSQKLSKIFNDDGDDDGFRIYDDELGCTWYNQTCPYGSSTLLLIVVLVVLINRR